MKIGTRLCTTVLSFRAACRVVWCFLFILLCLRFSGIVFIAGLGVGFEGCEGGWDI